MIAFLHVKQDFRFNCSLWFTRGQAGLPCGLISNLNLGQKQQLTCLFPKEKDVPDIEYREIHQVIIYSNLLFAYQKKNFFVS